MRDRILYKLSIGIINAKGGGGGGSGVVDYPAYMKDFHGDLLNHTGVDTISDSLVDVMNAMLGSSPFTGETAYDPDTDLAANATALSDFETILSGINEPVDWGAIYAAVTADIDGVEEADIATDVAAFAAVQDDQINTVVLPRFESGMRDINAVTSSAFALGKSNIEGFRNRDVAQHSSKLRIAAMSGRQQLYLNASEQVLQFTMQKYAWQESYVTKVIEANRIKIVAKKEEAEINLNIDEADANWDISVFQHGGNLLAGIGGGTVQVGQKKQSQAASAIGGAMTGAAAGAMVAKSLSMTGPQGAIAGAVLGLASSFL
jgi:Tfp pilus assembly major pilin PilA